MIKLSDELPESFVDILGIDENGNKHRVFRCDGKNTYEWRCSITGWKVIVKIIEWKYENDKKYFAS